MSNRSVITIGNFDGVHKGHQQLLSRAQQWAKEMKRKVIVLSFDPHPMEILRPEIAPKRLGTIQRRTQMLKTFGADEVIYLEPKRDLLQLEPEDFVKQIVEQYKPAAFIEGNDFRFGRQRRGNIDLLKSLGQEMNFEVDTVPTCDITLSNHHIVRASSSIVRWLIEKGRVVDANMVMGHPFVFESIVVEGEKVGRQLGFPTINLELERLQDHQMPALGVYGGRAIFEKDEVYTAAISIGIKPTFGVKQLCIEAHLLDCNKDLYNRFVQLELHQWVRDQYPFPSVLELKHQLKKDVDQIRNDQKLIAQTPLVRNMISEHTE